MGLSTFTFKGIPSSNFGIFIEHRPAHVTPKRVIQSISIPGRSGNLLYDTGSYDNVTVTYQVAYISNRVRENAIDIATWLYGSDYDILEDTYYPDYFRKAIYASPLSVADTLNVAGSANITFECMPQRFLKSGLVAITPANGDEIQNLYQPSLPTITVSGADGELTVGSSVITITGMTDDIIIDSTAQNATMNGQNANMNISVSGGFPVLAETTEVSWSGGITGVSIIPNWWTL